MKGTKVMYVEDCDSNDEIVEGSQQHANNTEVESPTKANTSRTRRDGRKLKIRPPTDSESSTPQPSSSRRDKEARRSNREREEREREDKEREKERRRRERREREKEAAAREAERERVKEKKSKRPSLRLPVPTEPALHHGQAEYVDQQAHYGVSPATQAPRLRQRPLSYSNSRPPPPSAAAFWASQPAFSPFPMPTSYPPQPWAPPGHMSYPAAPPGQPQEYFPAQPQPQPQPHNHLARRFGGGMPSTPIERPSSVQGFRPQPAYSFDREEPREEQRIVRRGSVSRRQQEDDKARMPPPPPRPQTTRPTLSAPRPPPPAPPKRRSIHLTDDDLESADPSLYQDVSPYAEFHHGSLQLRPAPRRGSVSYGPAAYPSEAYVVEPASRSNRRHSYMGNERGAERGAGFEEKLRHATAYQNHVSGPNPPPLTAENIKRANKRSSGNSSRSTRSSGSRDDSDFRQQSNTTKTSYGGDDDVTIKVPPEATVEFQGARIHCPKGGDVNISQTARAGGSDRGSTVFGPDDRRSRVERGYSDRTRVASQSGSRSRSKKVSHDPAWI